jgi:hypothetical protein
MQNMYTKKVETLEDINKELFEFKNSVLQLEIPTTSSQLKALSAKLLNLAYRMSLVENPIKYTKNICACLDRFACICDAHQCVGCCGSSC